MQENTLQGISVLDLTHLLPGPLATQMLMEMGANVVKVEHPERPDMTKFYPPIVDDIGVNYTALNQGKTIWELDYLSPAGKALLLSKIATTDVFIEQFRPGIMAKYGLDYASLQAINPRLIYVSITGYGQKGEMSTYAGHDLNYLAVSGVLSLITDSDGQPVIPGIQLADIAGGSYRAVSAILGALFLRERTGKGSYHDISMVEGLEAFLKLLKAQLGAGESLYPARKTLLSGYLPYYNVYACADEKHIALAALEPKFWVRFCTMVDRMDWVDLYLPLDENVALLKAELALLFRTKSSMEWDSLGKAHDCCLTAVLDI